MKPKGASAIIIQIPKDCKTGGMGRAGCLAGESSNDYSQPVVRAGLGKEMSEHPTFLGWEYGPRGGDKLVSYGWILPALKVDGVLPLSPGLQNPPVPVAPGCFVPAPVGGRQ